MNISSAIGLILRSRWPVKLIVLNLHRASGTNALSFEIAGPRPSVVGCRSSSLFNGRAVIHLACLSFLLATIGSASYPKGAFLPSPVLDGGYVRLLSRLVTASRLIVPGNSRPQLFRISPKRKKCIQDLWNESRPENNTGKGGEKKIGDALPERRWRNAREAKGRIVGWRSLPETLELREQSLGRRSEYRDKKSYGHVC